MGTVGPWWTAGPQLRLSLCKGLLVVLTRGSGPCLTARGCGLSAANEAIQVRCRLAREHQQQQAKAQKYQSSSVRRCHRRGVIASRASLYARFWGDLYSSVSETASRRVRSLSRKDAKSLGAQGSSALRILFALIRRRKRLSLAGSGVRVCGRTAGGPRSHVLAGTPACMRERLKVRGKHSSEPRAVAAQP